jgi:glycosyltransferase involved in cell wall biosynthesis
MLDTDIVAAMTLAVVGHNESATLLTACAQAAAAARPQDRVVFVDSASTDGSGAVAREAGFPVVDAPLGKGAAVRTLLQQAETDWVVLLDGDLLDSERSLAAPLAEAVRADPSASAVLGDFVDRVPGVLSATWSIYEPLVRALFPEAAGRFGSHPLTGFRAVRKEALGPLDDVPDDFGLEAHLNIRTARSGHPWSVVDLGWYEGRFLYKPTMGAQIGRAVLDEAVRTGSLSGARRPDWDAWVAHVVHVIAGYRGEPDGREAFVERLGRARERPLPPRA